MFLHCFQAEKRKRKKHAHSELPYCLAEEKQRSSEWIILNVHVNALTFAKGRRLIKTWMDKK